MCHANLWNQIVIQLEAANMWKHVHVIAMGDMCQLPPPNKYKALYVDFVLKARRPQMFASDSEASASSGVVVNHDREEVGDVCQTDVVEER